MSRAAVLRAVEHFVPSDYGDERFAEMLDGHWEPGAGTTCTYLPAAVLYYAGAREPQFVNHDDERGRTAFEIGAGVSKLVQGARAIDAWVDDAPGREPRAGDIAFLSNGPLTEHVEIVLDPAVWKAAAAGQTNESGNQAARVVTRSVDDRRDRGGPRLLSAPSPLPVAGSWRKLVGWVDVDRVPFVEAFTGPAIAPGPSTAEIVTGVVLVGGALGLVLGALSVRPARL